MKTVLCATRLELEGVDTTYLTMNSFNITDNLLEGLQVVAEGESVNLVFTESILEEQMTDEELINYIHLLNTLYPKKVRMVYLKRRRNSDAIVDTLYIYNNWDIYYNIKLAHVDSTELIRMVDERKLPDMEYKKAFSSEEVIESGLAMKDTLLETLKSTRDFDNNVFFQSAVTRNLTQVRDMVLTLDLNIKELSKEKKANNANNAQIAKLNQDLIKLQVELNQTEEYLNKTTDVNTKLMKELTLLQSRYNTLVNTLTDLIFIERVNTLNHRHKRIEKSGASVPNILYVKQVSHLNHFTTYLSNLVQVMNDSVGVTKAYVIESETNLLSIPRYEARGYSYVTDGTSLPEIVLNNLVSCGLEPKLLDFLVDNSLNVDYLIIVDKTGVNFDLVSGNHVMKLLSARSQKDIELLGLQNTAYITNERKTQLYLPIIKDYHQFLENKQLELSLVASLELTKMLIIMLTEFDKMNAVESSEVKFDKNSSSDGDEELEDEVLDPREQFGQEVLNNGALV